MQFAKISVLLVSILLGLAATLSAQKKQSKNKMEADNSLIKIKGVVVSIEGSPCSYTAEIKTVDNKMYFCQFLFPLLDTDEHCRQLIIGETIVLAGKKSPLTSAENHLLVGINGIEPFSIEDNENFTVIGKVLSIQEEEDGYQMQIQTTGSNPTIYYAIVSISNIKDVEDFKNAAVGNMIKVSGQLWEAENKARIMVSKVH
jgi:hypothetical protein